MALVYISTFPTAAAMPLLRFLYQRWEHGGTRRVCKCPVAGYETLSARRNPAKHGIFWRGHAGLACAQAAGANFAGGRPGTGAEITLETNPDLATDRNWRAGGPRV